MSGHLEVEIKDGRARARRRDGLPLTEDDRAAARRIADELRTKPGITKEDIFRVFGTGCRVIEEPISGKPKPSHCADCTKDSVPEWRRGGRIAQGVAADGERFWMCILCGRRLSSEAKKRVPKPKRKPQ